MVDTSGLRLDQAPPIHVPFRLFITAPLFLIGAGLVLATGGESVSVSRWTPGALAFTHLVAIGFLSQIMCGALLQLLPVLLGAPVPGVVGVGTWTHLLLSLGTVLLAWGFLGGGSAVLGAGALICAVGFVVFLGALLSALWHALGDAATRTSLRLAALSLVVTLVLGLVLVGALSGAVVLADLPRWVTLHFSWGLLGWVGLLVVGVGYQLAPLFHVTPPYPKTLRRMLGPGIWSALLVASLLLASGRANWAILAYDLIALGFSTFAVMTLILQIQRDRPRIDPTLVHWWLSIAAVLAAAILWWGGSSTELLGVMILVGVGVGLPSGMLLKIAPFLSWFHLQSRQMELGALGVRVPHMHRLLPGRLARLHPWLHLAALILLVWAVLSPAMGRIAGLALALSAAWMLVLLAGALWRYRRAERDLIAAAARPEV